MAIQLAAQTAQTHGSAGPEGTGGPRRPLKPAAQAATGAAQGEFDATDLGSPVLLDKGWRVGITADPAAATAGFDDSSWAIRDAQKFIADVPYDESGDEARAQGAAGSGPSRGEQRPYAWFRLHIKLAPHHGDLALLLELPVSPNTSMAIGSTGPGVDVFANGRQIEPQGPHGDDPDHYQQISRIYKLNLAPQETSLTLAVRTNYVPFGLGAYTSFFANRSFLLGNAEDLNRALELWSIAQSLRAAAAAGELDPDAGACRFFCWRSISRRKATWSTCGWRCTSFCRRRSALWIWPAVGAAWTDCCTGR